MSLVCFCFLTCHRKRLSYSLILFFNKTGLRTSSVWLHLIVISKSVIIHAYKKVVLCGGSRIILSIPLAPLGWGFLLQEDDCHRNTCISPPFFALHNWEGNGSVPSFFFLFKKMLLICLFIFGCAGSLLLCRLFSSCREWGLLFVAVWGLLFSVATLAEHRL